MSKFKHLAKEQYISNLLKEFVNSQNQQSQLLSEAYSGLDPKSNLYHAIQLGEQTAKSIQLDILTEYVNDHPVLKEDIFQRGAAKAKAWLTTPLGKGFTQGKDTQVIQNLFAALKKNTEKIVNAGASPFAPSAEDVKNSPTQIGQIGALIGKRFAALQNNPKLNAPATPSEQQAGMGRIQQLIDKLRSTGLVKGADNVLDEIGIFARQHPVLTNMIVGGLVSVLTLATTGPLAAIPLLNKFVIGTALRTLIGMLKGEKATQAATKGAMVSGAGIAIGKLLGLFYDKLAAWLSGPEDGSALPIPAKPVPQPMDVDTSALGKEEYLSSYRGMLVNKAENAASAEEFQTYLQQIKNMDAQYDFNGELPQYDGSTASGQLPPGTSNVTPPAAPSATVPPGNPMPPEPPPVTGVDVQPTLTTLRPKLDTLAKLASTTDVKGATAPAARQALQNWVAGISQPEAQTMLADPNVTNQLMRKGALGLLKQKFGIRENKKAELDKLKDELKEEVKDQFNEANPFTAVKNFAFGGPKVGGDNARLDYKQVESDYLKFLNNMESSLGLKSEKDILDTLRKDDKNFPGVYDYVKKVRDWLYGATPESNKPTPDPVIVPPSEEPKPPIIQTPPQVPTPSSPDGEGEFKMDPTTLKNVKLFLTQLIELSNVINKANPQNLDKATLKSLAIASLNIGDILVNKKGVGKSNQMLDKVLQGIDILGPLPPPKVRQASTTGPVSSIFTEETGYKNPELTKQIVNLKSSPLFKGLQQRIVNLLTIGSGAGFNNLDNPESIIALRKVLSDVNNIILKFSPQVSQKLGANPLVVKKEIEGDKGFVKEVASEQQRVQFIKELTAAMPNIIGLMVSLRQAFNRKNPNNIYKQDIKPTQPSSNDKPEEKPKSPNVPWTDPRSGKGGEDDARMEESKYNLRDYRKFF